MKRPEEIINEFEEQEETGVGTETLMGWLKEVEQELQELRCERYGIEQGPVNLKSNAYLSVQGPWDSMYIHYLKAMVAYRNGETARYNNAMAMYQQVMASYRAWFIRQHLPVQIKATYF